MLTLQTKIIIHKLLLILSRYQIKTCLNEILNFLKLSIYLNTLHPFIKVINHQ